MSLLVAQRVPEDICNIFVDLSNFLSLSECQPPTWPNNGMVGPGYNTIYSERVVTCNTGYAQIGGTQPITCQTDQNWTTWTGSCVSCPAPSTINNAVISPGDTKVGSLRMYSCVTGYQANGGDYAITCESDATWSSTNFACSIIGMIMCYYIIKNIMCTVL